MANTINLGRVKGSMWYTGTADDAGAIAAAISGAGYTPVALDLYLNVVNGNIYQYVPSDGDVLTWSLQGNIKGVKGDPFAVAKTYASVAAMNAGYVSDGVKEGQFVIVETGDVNNEENARLFVKGAAQYEFITDLSGAQGIKGDRGDTGAKGDPGAKGDTGPAAGFGDPIISIKKLSPEATPTAKVTASGADTQKVFEFEFAIPQGERGESGDNAGFGQPEASATVLAAGSNPTAKVTASGPSTAQVFKFEFGIPKGDTGEKGEPGDRGADGKTPTFSVNANGELIATFN